MHVRDNLIWSISSLWKTDDQHSKLTTVENYVLSFKEGLQTYKAIIYITFQDRSLPVKEKLWFYI